MVIRLGQVRLGLPGQAGAEQLQVVLYILVVGSMLVV